MNTRSGAHWLLEQLPALVRDGVLDDESAERLRRHYRASESESEANVALLAFGVLGAVLIGSGLILLLAHNWDELGRGTRTAMAFALLLAGQAVAGWSVLRRPTSDALREATASFLVLAIGACIALVSQTWQMPGDLAAFVLTWMLLALPVAYLMDARLAAAAYWIGITVWLVQPFPAVGDTAFLRFWALGALTVPYLLRIDRRHRGEARTAVVFWAVALSVAVALAGAPVRPWVLAVCLGGLFGTLYGVGVLDSHGARMPWCRPFHTVGGLGWAAVTLWLGFGEAWEWFWRRGDVDTPWHLGVVTILLAATSVALAAVFFSRREIHRGMLGLLPAVAALGGAFAAADSSTAPMLLMNVYGLAAGLLLFRAGARRDELGTVNAGLLLVASLVATRFFDAELSFVARGVAFILLGVGFLVANLVMVRRRKRKVA